MSTRAALAVAGVCAVATGVVGAALSLVGCERAAPAPAAPAGDPAAAPTDDPTAARESALGALDRWEQTERARIDWRAAPPAQRARGPEPVAIERVLNDRWLVALRGQDEVMLVDTGGVSLARAPGPASVRAIAEGADGTVLAVGERDARVFRYRVHADRIEALAPITAPGVFGLRGVASDLAIGAERIYGVDALAGEVLTLDAQGRRLGALPVGPGALVVKRAGALVVACGVEAHRCVVAPVDARGVPDPARALALTNDGPIWSMDARVVGDEVLVAFGLAEDHPLDRTQGSFQFIDSFLRVEAIKNAAWRAGAPPTPRRVLLVNLSERNVVLPKAVRFTRDDTVLVAAAGSPRIAAIRLDPADFSEVRALPPGAAALAPLGDALGVGAMIANPLLDAVVRAEGSGERVEKIAGGAPRRPLARVGEALLFTNLIAPRQKTDGGLSRFTCETCHFEGVGDGRVHSTGRGDVHATTKPLFGLGNNVPLFTRALDPGLVRMAHNEFRVANAESDNDPWFSISLEDAPWLTHLGVTQPLAPEVLRQALASALFEMTPETNPRVVGRASFSPLERDGQRVFAARCARCHAARLVTDDARSAVDESGWEALVLSPSGPLVWARDGYEKTGVEPYVHPSGARPSSLRRIERKTPYFTNGSARTLDDVLERARFDDAGLFLHHTERADLRALTDDERRALRAFLVLL